MKEFRTNKLILNDAPVTITGSNLYINGEILAPTQPDTVYTTGDQNISGTKRFVNISAELISGNNENVYIDLTAGVLAYSGTAIVDWQHFGLNDADSIASVSWDARVLTNDNLRAAYNWQQNILYSTVTANRGMVNINSGILSGITNAACSLNWSTGKLFRSGIATVDWNNCILNGKNGAGTILWDTSPTLVASNGVSLTPGFLYDGGGNIMLEWGQNNKLVYVDENPALSWNADGVRVYGSQTYDNTSLPAIDLQSGFRNYTDSNGILAAQLGSFFDDDGNILYLRRLYNMSGENIVDFQDPFVVRQPNGFSLYVGGRVDGVVSNILYNADGAITVDAVNRILSGNWQSNVAPTNSGHIVNKGYLDTFTGLDLGTVSSESVALTKTINWSTSTHFYQPLSGTGISFAFTGTREGQTINIVTYSTGNSLIQWPTGAAGGIPILWAGNIPFSGTSGSATTGKHDLFTFTRISNNIFASYSANHYR